MKTLIERYRPLGAVVAWLLSLAVAYGMTIGTMATKAYVDGEIDKSEAKTTERLNELNRKSDRMIELLLEHAQHDKN